jgi:hypothetical protein
VVYSSFTRNWTWSVAYWLEDCGRHRLAAWLARDSRALDILLRPAGKLLALAGVSGRMIVVAVAEDA